MAVATKIEKIDRAAAKKISDAVKTAVEMVAEDLGLNVEMKGGRFDPQVGTYAPKVEFSLDGAEEAEFALDAPLFGLKPEDYGKVIQYGGQDYKVVGLNTRAPRYPVKAIRVADGERRKLGEQAIRLLGGEAY